MTKFLMSLLLSTLTICTSTTSAHSVALNGETPSIEVKGQSSVVVTPDRFSLNIAIVERGRITDKIRAVVDHKSTQVVQVAKSLGVENHDITSARVTLRAVKNKPSIIVEGVEANLSLGKTAFPKNQHNKVYVDGNAVNSQNSSKLQYFELSRTISINFSHIDDYDKFLSKVIKLGVNHISPLTMSVANTEKHYQLALVQAITNAKNKASKIAMHTNVVLGKLRFVKEQSSNYYRPRSNSTMMSADVASNHTSQVGNQVINASVLVKFSIQE